MPGRSFVSGTGYRYGFNGKEKNDEVHGHSGDNYDYGMRAYDARLGRFMSIDPISKKYPGLTPYQYASNNPILNVDIDGLEGEPYGNLSQSNPGNRRGIYNTDWGFATAASANQANNQADEYGARITGTKYYNYSLPWTTLYLWQKPVLTVTNVTTVTPTVFPNPPVAQAPVVAARSINFGSNSPALSAGGVSQVNQIAAMARPTTVTQPTGPAIPQPSVTVGGLNAEGIPATTTTQQILQPIQTITTNTTITVNIATSLPNGPAATALLNARFANISAQLQTQGISAANITMAPLTPANFGQNGLTNGNQTTFTLNTTTTTATGTQTTTNTKTTGGTYEK